LSSPPHIKGYVCQSCGWTDFHPAEACAHCHGRLRETLLSGSGKVATFTIIRYPPKGFENEAPYAVAIIDLDKGPRVIGRVSNSDDEEAKIGAEVVLRSIRNGTLEFQLVR
jgi:uncharacterized OB-fold protein